MPIYRGNTEVSPKYILIGENHISKVYMGDTLVWSKNYEDTAKYGFLYNLHAVQDARGLAPTGWHVPTLAEYLDMFGVLVEESAGKKLKGLAVEPADHPRWNKPNVGATNEFGFNGYGGGYREDDGTFDFNGFKGYWWTSDGYYFGLSNDRTEFFYSNDFDPRYGLSVRLVKDDSVLGDSTMQDNDGNTYDTVSINGAVWMVENLRSERFRGSEEGNDYIDYVLGDGGIIEDEQLIRDYFLELLGLDDSHLDIPNVKPDLEWKSLETSAFCIYDYNIEKKDIYHNKLKGLQGGKEPNEYYHLTQEEYENLCSVPSGGGGGDVLVKASADDCDLEWVNPSIFNGNDGSNCVRFVYGLNEGMFTQPSVFTFDYNSQLGFYILGIQDFAKDFLVVSEWVSSLINHLENSPSKAVITITKVGDSSKTISFEASNYGSSFPLYFFISTNILTNTYTQVSFDLGDVCTISYSLYGVDGVQGSQGNQGQIGIGTQGNQGYQGNQGQVGVGTQGNQGFQGQTGVGVQGIQGNQGHQGQIGVGVQGNQGFQGNQGQAGVGTQGNQGFQGQTGVGVQGAAGTGLTNRGLWISGTDYYEGDYVFDDSSSDPLINSMWICQLDILNSTTQPKNDLTHWVEFEAPKGEQGNQGYQGQIGVGVQGNQGNQGQVGVGVQGVQGHQGQVGVGTQGVQGNQGFQGQVGVGTQGVQGHQGFQGQVGVGTQGVQGHQGFQGQIGVGIQGNQGHQGNRGYQGVGVQGNQGNQGQVGAGTQGVQGNQGFQGQTGVGTQGVQGHQGQVGVGVQGNQGNQGQIGVGVQGNQGFQGAYGGNSMKFLYSTAGGSSVNYVHLNNSFGYYTLWISSLDFYNNDIYDWLDGINVGDVVKIYNQYDPSKFVVVKVEQNTGEYSGQQIGWVTATSLRIRVSLIESHGLVNFNEVIFSIAEKGYRATGSNSVIYRIKTTVDNPSSYYVSANSNLFQNISQIKLSTESLSGGLLSDFLQEFGQDDYIQIHRESDLYNSGYYIITSTSVFATYVVFNVSLLSSSSLATYTNEDVVHISFSKRGEKGSQGNQGNQGYQGYQGDDGREIQLRLQDPYIQWAYVGSSTWYNIIDINELIGPAGADGSEIELRVNAGYIQWHYVGNAAWYNLIAITALKGDKGDTGDTGPVPNHEWSGTSLRFELPSGFWGNSVNLKGDTGQDGSDGREIELGIFENPYTGAYWMRWRYVGDATWYDLINMASLAGASGSDGDDGREIELQVANGYIQWRYVGDATWTNLIALSEITGPPGSSAESTWYTYHTFAVKGDILQNDKFPGFFVDTVNGADYRSIVRVTAGTLSGSCTFSIHRITSASNAKVLPSSGSYQASVGGNVSTTNLPYYINHNALYHQNFYVVIDSVTSAPCEDLSITITIKHEYAEQTEGA